MKTSQAEHALALRDDGRQVLAQQRARARELLAGVRRNMVAITESFFEIGEALAEIHNNALHRALGHPTFEALLLTEDLMSLTQANKLIAVAELVPRESAIALGQEKSFALTRYARVAEPANGVRGLLTAGRIDGRPLGELSVRDLKGLVARLNTRRGRSARSAARVEALRLARLAQAALRRRGATSARAVAVMGRGGVRYRLELDDAGLRALLGPL